MQSIPEEPKCEDEREFHAYADGANPKELRKAVLFKIKYLEDNGRTINNIDIIHTIVSHLFSSKEEYLSGKAKRDK